MTTEWREQEQATHRGMTFTIVRVQTFRGKGYASVLATADGGACNRIMPCRCEDIVSDVIEAVDLVTEEEFAVCPKCRGEVR